MCHIHTVKLTESLRSTKTSVMCGDVGLLSQYVPVCKYQRLHCMQMCSYTRLASGQCGGSVVSAVTSPQQGCYRVRAFCLKMCYSAGRDARNSSKEQK